MQQPGADAASWVLLDWTGTAPREAGRFAKWNDADAAAQQLDGKTSIEDSRTWDRIKASGKRSVA
ncbi:hypothetical protein [Rhizobium sp. LC145]|uniref:hypothetical protein n=1 Tax=Pseudomonadota TaxID=1224 RepID=UPI00062A21A5|nr:hypothetical protein [Rhizobium sp. LC145]KKX24152.1 hypothetical protein YH62_27770 [Rhizobium sp. LC145]TKT46062.1 hypothetical protein FDR95_24310 [Rhizobiaceae bacterium LC148]